MIVKYMQMSSSSTFCNGALSPRRLLPAVPFSKKNAPAPAQETHDTSYVLSPIPPRMFKDELKALMGGDDSAGQSDNEDYYATLNSNRGGTQSADTSPLKQPSHPHTSPAPANQRNTALQEMLKNKVFIVLLLDIKVLHVFSSYFNLRPNSLTCIDTSIFVLGEFSMSLVFPLLMCSPR